MKRLQIGRRNTRVLFITAKSFKFRRVVEINGDIGLWR